jgi:hypothetical protein
VAVAMNGDLPVTDDALETLVALCTSPCWEPAMISRAMADREALVPAG